MISLQKNPLFCMLDTETIFMKKRVYELACVIFDSVTCDIIVSKKWYIRETVESALYYQLRNNKPPIFWPNRLNPFSVLKDAHCVEWSKAINELMALLAKNDVSTLIAHNVNFDISAIYATHNLYKAEDFTYTDNEAFLSSYEKLELSGYFIHGLPLMTAYNAPFKLRSGCVTFKADYLVPLLINGIQAHDALGDCLNQVSLYKLTKGIYANTGTIYGNMLKHHKERHDGQKRLGDTSLD